METTSEPLSITLPIPDTTTVTNIPLQQWLVEIGLTDQKAQEFASILTKYEYQTKNEILLVPPSETQLLKYGVPPGKSLNLLLKNLVQPTSGVLKRNREGTPYQEYSFEDQCPCDGSQPIVKISVQVALGDENNMDKLLYVHDEVKEAWNKLETTPYTAVVKQGPPGTGKSSICWAWACYRSSIKKENVLWIHIGRRENSRSFLEGNTVHHSAIAKGDIIPSIQNCHAKILIIDGLTEERRTQLCPAAFSWRWQGRKTNNILVLVTSSQLKFGIEDKQNTEMIDYPSWTLEQMLEACNQDEFYNHISKNLGRSKDKEKEEVIKDKFSLTGGSARWMFGYDKVSAREDIDLWIERSKDVSLIIQGLVGDLSDNAVSHLLSKNKEKKSVHIKSVYYTSTWKAT